MNNNAFLGQEPVIEALVFTDNGKKDHLETTYEEFISLANKLQLSDSRKQALINHRGQYYQVSQVLGTLPPDVRTYFNDFVKYMQNQGEKPALIDNVKKALSTLFKSLVSKLASNPFVFAESLAQCTKEDFSKSILPLLLFHYWMTYPENIGSLPAKEGFDLDNCISIFRLYHILFVGDTKVNIVSYTEDAHWTACAARTPIRYSSGEKQSNSFTDFRYSYFISDDALVESVRRLEDYILIWGYGLKGFGDIPSPILRAFIRKNISCIDDIITYLDLKWINFYDFHPNTKRLVENQKAAIVQQIWIPKQPKKPTKPINKEKPAYTRAPIIPASREPIVVATPVIPNNLEPQKLSYPTPQLITYFESQLQKWKWIQNRTIFQGIPTWYTLWYQWPNDPTWKQVDGGLNIPEGKSWDIHQLTYITKWGEDPNRMSPEWEKVRQIVVQVKVVKTDASDVWTGVRDRVNSVAWQVQQEPKPVLVETSDTSIDIATSLEEAIKKPEAQFISYNEGVVIVVFTIEEKTYGFRYDPTTLSLTLECDDHREEILALCEIEIKKYLIILHEKHNTKLLEEKIKNLREIRRVLRWNRRALLDPWHTHTADPSEIIGSYRQMDTRQDKGYKGVGILQPINKNYLDILTTRRKEYSISCIRVSGESEDPKGTELRISLSHGNMIVSSIVSSEHPPYYQISVPENLDPKILGIYRDILITSLMLCGGLASWMIAAKPIQTIKKWDRVQYLSKEQIDKILAEESIPLEQKYASFLVKRDKEDARTPLEHAIYRFRQSTGKIMLEDGYKGNKWLYRAEIHSRQWEDILARDEDGEYLDYSVVMIDEKLSAVPEGQKATKNLYAFIQDNTRLQKYLILRAVATIKWVHDKTLRFRGKSQFKNGMKDHFLELWNPLSKDQKAEFLWCFGEGQWGTEKAMNYMVWGITFIDAMLTKWETSEIKIRYSRPITIPIDDFMALIEIEKNKWNMLTI